MDNVADYDTLIYRYLNQIFKSNFQNVLKHYRVRKVGGGVMKTNQGGHIQ